MDEEVANALKYLDWVLDPDVTVHEYVESYLVLNEKEW